MKLELRKIRDPHFGYLYLLILEGKRIDSFIFKSIALRYVKEKFPKAELVCTKALDSLPRWDKLTAQGTRLRVLPEHERDLLDQRRARGA